MKIAPWLRILALLVLGVPAAQAQLYRAFSVATSVTFQPGDVAYWKADCPDGTAAVGGGVTASSSSLGVLASGPQLSGAPFWEWPDAAVVIDPDGWVGAAANASPEAEVLTVVALCAPVQGMTTILSSASVADRQRAAAYATGCPAGAVVVSGGGATLDPAVVLDSSAPAIGNDFINNVADGNHPPPTGWIASAANFSGAAAQVRAAALCLPASEIQEAGTVVGTAVQGPDVALGTTSCGIGTLAVGAGISEAGPTIGQIQSFAPVFPSLPRFAGARSPGVYETFDAFLYAWYSPSSTPVTGKFATVCVLPAGTPNAAVRVVEYYNAFFGHYFITPLKVEIDALDAGQFPGWVRTGQTFLAFSQGTLSTAPVCRYFRQDVTSHFYSASIAECDAVKDFTGWIFETGRLFSGRLPTNLETGQCEQGFIPLYRLWNAKVNHRYTISLEIRAQMIAQGYVPEGYGPLGVAMCVTPDS